MAEHRDPQKIPLVFFLTSAGSEPVREWLKQLPKAERYAVGADLLRAQWRWPIGMPLCRPLGGGLWEIRTNLPTKRTARDLSASGTTRRIAWIHQEDTYYTRWRSEISAEAQERV